MTQEENEALMYASEEDIKFYHKCVEGLPTLAGLDGSGNGSDGIPLPYGTGPHSVRCLREIVDIVAPLNILEIGFNMGWSAAMWLELSSASLLTCDISNKKETVKAAEILQERYGQRFYYTNRNSEKFKSLMDFHSRITLDLIFIDGGHLIDDVIEDLNLAFDLKIPFIAMDDWMPEFGQIQDAVAAFGGKLEVINVNGNISLLKNLSI